MLFSLLPYNVLYCLSSFTDSLRGDYHFNVVAGCIEEILNILFTDGRFIYGKTKHCRSIFKCESAKELAAKLGLWLSNKCCEN